MFVSISIIGVARGLKVVKILSDIENMAVEEFNQKVIKGFGDSPLLRLKKNAKSMLFGKLSFEE